MVKKPTDDAFFWQPDADCAEAWSAAVDGIKRLNNKEVSANTWGAANQVEGWDAVKTPQHADIISKSSVVEAASPGAGKPSVAPVLRGQTLLEIKANPVEIIENSAQRQAGKTQGIDAKTMRRLAAGQMPFEEKLDLHGYYEGDAWLALNAFLSEAYESEKRCVLVIHGKGRGYGPLGDMGIIKFQIPQWFQNHKAVLAFHTATARDGGGGASYVYIRRRR